MYVIEKRNNWSISDSSKLLENFTSHVNVFNAILEVYSVCMSRTEKQKYATLKPHLNAALLCFQCFFINYIILDKY